MMDDSYSKENLDKAVEGLREFVRDHPDLCCRLGDVINKAPPLTQKQKKDMEEYFNNPHRPIDYISVIR